MLVMAHRNRWTQLCILLVFCFLSVAAAAESISAERIRKLNRLQPPKKLTVGPDDQYFAAPTANGRFLVFTRKSDLVAQLQIQDLQSGEVKALLPPDADSQEASFSPEGWLVFNYFRFNARGDVCWARPATDHLEALHERDLRCLKRSKETTATQRSNPFWKSRNEVGYLERAVGSQKALVISENIETGARTVLAEGKLWSPYMRSGGRYLVFNRWLEGTDSRRMVIKDLFQGGTEHIVQLSVPGISGFPILSEDEKILYFSHFINDTNADRSIDGSDNAVVFRVKTEAILQVAKKPADHPAGHSVDKQEVFPEQLTSVETSCSFPIPSGESVFQTCAFEGSLDIYQMPVSGVVPAAWEDKLLVNAIDSARSYQDRILLLNTVKYRALAGVVKSDTMGRIDEKLLSDHLLTGDITAARYYLNKLKAKSLQESERQYYALLDIYLSGVELKLQQPRAEVSREFRARIMQEDAKIDRLPAARSFRLTVHAWFREFLDDHKGASDFLKQVRPEGNIRPLERFIYFDLADKVEARNLPRSAGRLTDLYREMLSASELGEQAKLYYAFMYLRRLSEAFKVRSERVQWIERGIKGVPENVALLLNSELAVLRIIDAPDKDQKLKAYPAFDKFLVASKGNYFLRRALYMRAIGNFADASEFQYMGYVGDNWLKYTANDDTEFAFAREFFAVAALDRAYASAAAKDLALAGGYFYHAISVTDDLEGHWGFIHSMARSGRRQLIETRYKALTDQRLVEDNMKFVRAVLALVDGEAAADKDPGFVKHLDESIGHLKAMQTDRDSALRNLVLGYCYLEKLARLANGMEFDSGLFQEANRSLMLAYDLGRDNDRIKASALMNLGILHSRVQNHGLAARFFHLRKRLGFISDTEQMQFSWLAARAYEFSHQPTLAAEELLSVPAGVRTPAIEERTAYELEFAGKFSEANSLYHKIFSAKKVSGERSLAATHLAYGYSLLKEREHLKAAEVLQKAIDFSSRLSKTKHAKDELIDFEPLRIQLAATGLLAQATSGTEKIAALEARGRYLEKAKDLTDEWIPLRIQNRLQLAEALLESDRSRASQMVQEALRLTEEYAEANQYFGNAVFRATVAGLVDGSKNPANYSKGDVQRVEKLTMRSLEAYEKSKDTVLAVQKMKLNLLRTVFQAKHGCLRSDQAHSMAQAMIVSPEAMELKKVLPPAGWTELEKLAAAVQLF
jgi:hypothetical protein